MIYINKYEIRALTYLFKDVIFYYIRHNVSEFWIKSLLRLIYI